MPWLMHNAEGVWPTRLRPQTYRHPHTGGNNGRFGAPSSERGQILTPYKTYLVVFVCSVCSVYFCLFIPSFFRPRKYHRCMILVKYWTSAAHTDGCFCLLCGARRSRDLTPCAATSEFSQTWLSQGRRETVDLVSDTDPMNVRAGEKNYYSTPTTGERLVVRC